MNWLDKQILVKFISRFNEISEFQLKEKDIIDNPHDFNSFFIFKYFSFQFI